MNQTMEKQMMAVWDITTNENIAYFRSYEACMEFIKASGDPNYKITSAE